MGRSIWFYRWSGAPINPYSRAYIVIKLSKILCWFLHYWWQFAAVIGAAVYSLYLASNRVLCTDPPVYWPKNGYFGLCIGRFHKYSFTYPSSGHLVIGCHEHSGVYLFTITRLQRVFAPVNFPICFLLFKRSVRRIILFLERQQQRQALAENCAAIKSQTELQLLQQQINPHFLF